MANLKLIQSEVCPYAQRTHMCMLEKGLDFEVIEVDLSNKPRWFEEISPYSKVPVLQDGDVLVYESAIINEYVDEVYPNPPLMPKSAAKRAEARIWIDFDNVKFVSDYYKVLLEQNQDKRQNLVDEIVGHLEFFETRGLGENWKGPYWFNDQFSLVDLTLYPHFERIAVLETYRGISIPDSCPRLADWLQAVKDRPSARLTSHDDDYHISAYSHYADGTADGTTARDMRD